MTASEAPAHVQLGMTNDEYADVVNLLGREPRPAELAMYSVMWSEHCSYKSSRTHLGRFRSDQPWVVVGPGENAGVVDLGDGWLAALRIESHNHPSFVEPYQGAATGVGGILRDIFTMGARPIAVWDSIRFGPLDDPSNRYLFEGVISGIAGYGNAVGVPTLGGEVEFADRFSKNPMVNVMALGILRGDQLVLSAASGIGNVAVLLGNATGRDGIGGASILASASFEEGDEEKRPSVQVGDPFEEKKLIEVCLELYDKGLVVAIQDLGAAGISCATSETAGNGGMGMKVDLDSVHVREPGMTPGEILMSESQERMLAIVSPDQVDEVLAIAAKWEIDASTIGVVTQGPQLEVSSGGSLVAEVPAASLADEAPRYDRPAERPGYLDDLWASEPVVPDAIDVGEAIAVLLDDPALGDRSWISSQYDHMLFLNTVIEPGHDGSLLRIKGTHKAMAVSTDGDSLRTYLDPKRGAARIVFESALNVAVTGARPYALVDNLNFGNPEEPGVMWQFIESVDGMAWACEELDVPVVGGNVSFYNQTDGVDIYPTPVAGMLGFCDPMPKHPPRLDRATEGMAVWLVGPEARGDFAASAYDRILNDHLGGRPLDVDGDTARRVVAAAATLAYEIPVLHDVSLGGVAVALAEIAFASDVGFMVDGMTGSELFDETPLRFLAVASGNQLDTQVPRRRIGTIGGDRLDFGQAGSISLDRARRIWQDALPRRMR
ncbi:Phosphoribosylformylglycinamidine synthase, synthetase subunit [hydrothermal vent metagenome]|uniref:Phosphoribosylformylglycinamidine synthase, synthetase subunit n=1 Tax=hydrothermal vent metagenome TaxID=652676 RepID=A0A3B0RNB1_9ZZZZ